MGEVNKKHLVGINEPTTQLQTLIDLNKSKSGPNSEVCIHNWPHVTFLNRCRAPNDYQTVLEKCAKEYGGRKAFMAQFSETIKNRESYVCWASLIEEFNELMEISEN